MDLLPNIEKEKDYQPARWSPRHRLVVLLHLSGLRNGEIGEIVGMDHTRVSVILNDPRSEVERKNLAGMVLEKQLEIPIRYQQLAHVALDRVQEVLEGSEEDKIVLQAGFGILDRAGYGVKKGEGGTVVSPIDSDVLNRMAAVLEDMKRYQEVEYEIVEVSDPDLDEEVSFADL